MSNIELIDGNIDELTTLSKSIQDQLVNCRNIYDEEKLKLTNIGTELRAEATKVKTLGTGKAKEIAFIEKGVCPTCGAPIDQSQLEIKKQEREVLLKQYNNITEKIKANDVLTQNNLSQYQESVKPLKEELDDIKAQIVRLKEQAKRKNVNQEEIDRLQSEKDKLTRDYDMHLADSLSWERLNSILSNDVRAKILESFIPALNKNIMNYATELHQPYIVSFDNSFKCSVSLCGYGSDIPLSALSTGQLKTVDMMIILGVLGTVIGSAATNVIFLDELFSNLDGGLRNDMCSVLHNFISTNDTMFVISHQDLDERYFNGTMKLHIDHHGQYEKHSSVTFTKHIIE
jgi:DNA repair exonuclease SbcCD ATPase subunit